jgi:hypothetical protein
MDPSTTSVGAPVDRPLFVVGYPRSGTTMLRLMLHSHPRLAIPYETSFLLAAYRHRRQFSNLTDPANHRRLADFIVSRQEGKFDLLGLERSSTRERILAAPPTLGSALAAVYSAYAERHGKPRWGDKRPSYVRWLGVLLRLFPDAQIINIVRDGRDCMASLLDVPWYSKDIYYWVAQWTAAVDIAARAQQRLPAGTFCQLRYEDLVTSPEPQLRRLCDFLGETYDPAMSEPNRLAESLVPPSKIWHGRTRSPVTTDRIGAWAKRLEPWQVEVCEAAMGERLRALGYELSGAARPALTHRLRSARAAVRPRLSPFKRAVVGAWGHLRPSPVLAAQPALAAQPVAPRPVAPRPAPGDLSPSVGAAGRTPPG